MTDFGNKLEQYVNGNLPACNHPIKAVDDNYFCHKCGRQLQPIKHVSEDDQLRARIEELTAENARLIAANESMQLDAVDNTFAVKLLKREIVELTEENRGLRQMLHMEPK